MANTAYQRMKADMTKAGFNPILGFAGGGASSPTVQAAAPSAPTVGAQSVGAQGVNSPQMQNALGQGIASAMQGSTLLSGIKRASAEATNTEKQGSVIDATNRKVSADADVSETDAKRRNEWNDAVIGRERATAGAANASALASVAQAARTNQDVDNNPGLGEFSLNGNLGPFAGASIKGPVRSLDKVMQIVKGYASPTSPSNYFNPRRSLGSGNSSVFGDLPLP